ncbi:glycogen synthesis protein GlgS [Salmonella enterica subsp. enterica]|nr:glycogen synthesis protein GlgS [Salmonella enterica subsp. enterica]
MNNNNVYSLNNFDFLARSFARMQAEGRPVDIQAVTGNMDEEHRDWFLQALRALLPAGDSGEKVRIRTLMQAPFTGAGHYSDLI